MSHVPLISGFGPGDTQVTQVGKAEDPQGIGGEIHQIKCSAGDESLADLLGENEHSNDRCTIVDSKLAYGKRLTARGEIKQKSQ